MDVEDQALLFNLLHDGTIERIATFKHGYKLSIDIPYLAEKLDPTFQHIFVDLRYVEVFYFEMSDSSSNIFKVNELIDLQLEILEADQESDRVKVFCRSSEKDLVGFLIFKTSQIEIQDPDGNTIGISKLQRLCSEYWDMLGKR
ncbi:hypothetical protein [Paenibacillus sp. sgz302251]|uniref:hypothetical protein n=1 Tax=Paenibacillus sp. sgz302251 TaxID=3414493 RepID=UPI003C7CD930